MTTIDLISETSHWLISTAALGSSLCAPKAAVEMMVRWAASGSKHEGGSVETAGVKCATHVHLAPRNE